MFSWLFLSLFDRLTVVDTVELCTVEVWTREGALNRLKWFSIIPHWKDSSSDQCRAQCAVYIIAGHYSGCCYIWPWREVYYILNLADIFYPALLLITIHSRWAGMGAHTHTHTLNTVKVIMMAVWRAGEAFRWVIPIGKHKQDTISFSLLIEGVSVSVLLVILSTASISAFSSTHLSNTCYLLLFISYLLSSHCLCPLVSALLYCIIAFSLFPSFISLCLVFPAWAAGRITGCEQTNKLKSLHNVLCVREEEIWWGFCPCCSVGLLF